MTTRKPTEEKQPELLSCLKCDGEEFVERPCGVGQKFKGEEFDVVTLAMVCVKCGWMTMTNNQADTLAFYTADEYRRRNGLLTTSEIVSLRTGLGMSQREFAVFLDVGEASVKRWERWFVQEQIYDERIRARCSAANERTM